MDVPQNTKTIETYKPMDVPQNYTDYVLDETITLLFRRLNFDTAIESLTKIDKAIEDGIPA